MASPLHMQNMSQLADALDSGSTPHMLLHEGWLHVLQQPVMQQSTVSTTSSAVA